MTKLTLRPYQEECLVAIDQALEEAVAAGQLPRTLAVLATGTGKSIIFLELIRRWLERRPDGRVLIIAHRRELIYQPIEKAEAFFPALAPKMGIVMGNEDAVSAQVVVATVQTLNAGCRMDHLLQRGPFGLCILDESHHSPAASYQAALDRLGADCRVAGFTATPIRTDGDGLRKVFPSCAYRFPIDAAIDAGALVPFDALGFRLPVRLDGLRETEDGWEAEPLGDLLKAENVLEVVHAKWEETGGPGRSSICFTASVAQAHATALFFRDRGVAAESVDGSTPASERDRILCDFRAGRIQLVANCQVLTEGFDAPETSCILMVCPTKSDLAYVQKMGRGLRTADGKSNCLVLDFAPMAERNVVMAGDVLGQPREVATAQRKAEDSGILISALHLDQFGAVSSVDPTEVVVTWLEYMRRKSSLAWTLDGTLATATLSADAMLAVSLPDVTRIARGEKLKRAGPWRDRDERLLQALRATRLVLIEKVGGRWQSRTLGHFVSEDEAKAEADRVAERLADPLLAKRAQSWRRKPASDAQMRLLRQWGVWPRDPVDRGRASQMISDSIAKGQAVRHLRNEESRI